MNKHSGSSSNFRKDLWPAYSDCFIYETQDSEDAQAHLLAVLAHFLQAFRVRCVATDHDTGAAHTVKKILHTKKSSCLKTGAAPPVGDRLKV